MNPILIDLPETIETERLSLHIPCAGFGQEIHEAIIDGYPDYVKWLGWSEAPPTQQDCEIDCRMHHADFILRENIRYLIIEKSTGDLVGRCGFPSFQANWKIPQFGISYIIRKSKRLKGYATEAARAMTLLAFQNLSAKKVEIYCDSENIASIKIPLRLGFQLEYTQKGGWPRPDKKLATLQTYSIFSKDHLKTS